MKRNKIALAIVSMASTALLAACGSAPASNGSAATGNEIGKTIKIGYNLELSGAVAAYGQAEKNGADLAVEEINAAGGVDGRPGGGRTGVRARQGILRGQLGHPARHLAGALDGDQVGHVGQAWPAAV